MKELSLICNAEMVRAARSGQKTQHRTVIKTPKETIDFYLNGAGRWTNSKTGELHEIAYDARLDENGLAYFLVAGDMGWTDGIHCPYQVGDRLVVKEEYCEVPSIRPVPSPSKYDEKLYFYRADNDRPPWASGKWKPAKSMPREASRFTFEITNIRLQRLQDITEEEAIAEGMSAFCPGIDYSSRELLTAFSGQWDSRHGKKYPWDSNPWVWVREFKKVED